MRIYTVHQPPAKWREERRGPDRFAFVRDGFHFWAFVFSGLWLLYRRLWLALVLYMLVAIVIGVALRFANVASDATFFTFLLLNFLVGLEASSLRRWTMRRRGWREVGVVAAKNEEEAERRFFDSWEGDADAALSTSPAAPAAPFNALRRPAPSSQAIGLFPEPGAPR